MENIVQSAVQLKQSQIDAARPRFLKAPDFQQHTLFHWSIAAADTPADTPLQLSLRQACLGSLQQRGHFRRLIANAQSLPKDGQTSEELQATLRSLAGVYQFVLEQLRIAGERFNTKGTTQEESDSNLCAAVGHYEAVYGVFSYLEPKSVGDVDEAVLPAQSAIVDATMKGGIADSSVVYHTFTPQDLTPLLTWTSGILRNPDADVEDISYRAAEGIHRALRELLFTCIPKLMCNLALAVERQGQKDTACAALRELLSDGVIGRGGFIHDALTNTADKWLRFLGGPSQRATFLLATITEKSPTATSTSIEQIVRILTNTCNAHKLLALNDDVLQDAPEYVRVMVTERTECLRVLSRLQSDVKSQRHKDERRFGAGKLSSVIGASQPNSAAASGAPPTSRVAEIVTILDGIRGGGDGGNTDLVEPLQHELLRTLCHRLLGELMVPHKQFNIRTPRSALTSAASLLGLPLSGTESPKTTLHREKFTAEQTTATLRALVVDRLVGMWSGVRRVTTRRNDDGTEAERLLPPISIRSFMASCMPVSATPHWLFGFCKPDEKLSDWLQSTEIERGEEALKDINELFSEKRRMMQTRTPQM